MTTTRAQGRWAMRSQLTKSLLLLVGLYGFLLGATSGTPGSGSAARMAGPATLAGNGWLPGTWGHRIRTTVAPDSIQGSGTLLDFPVLLHLDASLASVFAGANANGSDLVITKG